MTQRSAEEIAAELTADERLVVANDAEWMISEQFDPAMKKCTGLGLFRYNCITPLGLAVRTLITPPAEDEQP